MPAGRDLVGKRRVADRSDAVTVAGRRLSDEGLAEAAAAVAAQMAGAGVVALEASATLETVVGVVGGLLAGVAVVPVPADAGTLERAHILRDSGATVLLTTTGTRPRGASRPGADRPSDTDTGFPPGLGILPVDLTARTSASVPPKAVLSKAVPSEASLPAGAPDDCALILYTSGTTGAPKGVVIGAAAVAADLDALAEAWAWTADDVLVHGLPLWHVHGLVLGVLGALRTGSRLVHTGRPTPEAYAAAAEERGGSLYFGVPTVWSRVAAEPAATGALRRARLLVSGSAALPRTVFDALEAACGRPPLERYGMTETLITLSGRVDAPRRAGTVGAALAGVEARVVGDDGSPLEADGRGIGSLEVRGPTLMSGYLHLPEVTAASFRPGGWFATGDAASVDPDGAHRIIGRTSTDLIKTGGYRVGAGEVEDALLGHPGVREAAVVGMADDDLGQIIVAYVVGDGLAGTGVDATALEHWVAERLSAHKRPRRVVFVEELPRNALGKVRKTSLRDASPPAPR